MTVLVGLVLAAVAFGADGGLRLERTTWTEVGLILGGAGLVARALLTGRAAGRLYGGLTLLAFAALGVFTAVSIVWSVAPGDSWLEANRTLAYVATFAGGLALVRIAPGRWAAVLNGISLACVVVCGWALLTKVFPGALAADETYARLREPFGYWNAIGLMAALGVPPLLWLAARRSGNPAANALAWPALGLLFTCIMLSYSRGALLALVLGLALWFAAVPLRLRGVLPLVAAASLGAGGRVGVRARRAHDRRRAARRARRRRPRARGSCSCCASCCWRRAGGQLRRRRGARLSPRTRRLAGRGWSAALALVPVALLLALARRRAAINGQVSDGWDEAHRPRGGDADQHPGPPARDLLGARALLARGVDDL